MPTTAELKDRVCREIDTRAGFQVENVWKSGRYHYIIIARLQSADIE